MDNFINTRLIMKNSLYISVLIFSVTFSAQAQIGIGTSTPIAAVDVNGTVRVTNLPVGTTDEITLTGSTSTRTLNKTNLGANLIIINNSLDTAPVSGTIGDLNLGAIPVSAGTILNLDLEIASGEYNSNATFIRLHTYNTNVNIAGIADGENGRHITLFFSETVNINIMQNSLLALPQNRILTAATTQLSMSGVGFLELVYKADAGVDGLGRWIVIKFRS